jgi:cytochrome P450
MAIAPITLSDGFYIPKNTRLEIPVFAIHTDTTYLSDANEFDGLRFYKRRQGSADEAGKHQFVSVSKEALSFGYGRHSCPGRFMGDIEIKLLLTHILRKYDIKNPEGVGRHANIDFENQVSFLSFKIRGFLDTGLT